MPIVQFVGPKAEIDVILELINQIPLWVASVEGLGVGIKDVTPIFISSIQKNPGECVVFYVQELFEVSLTGKSRTPGIRKALSRAIENGFNEFIATGKLAVRPTNVTVVTRRVHPDEGEYHNWDVPSDEEILKSMSK
jgi:hypothetical protein